MVARKGLLAPQNTFLDTIAARFDGTRKLNSFCYFIVVTSDLEIGIHDSDFKVKSWHVPIGFKSNYCFN